VTKEIIDPDLSKGKGKDSTYRWATDKSQPYVSTLNVPTGAVTVNAVRARRSIRGIIAVVNRRGC